MEKLKGLMMSNSVEWETPQDLFNSLNKEFLFLLDVCATSQNAKCDRYYTKAENGLEKKWSERNWMNPPYGREIGAWVKKAFDEAIFYNFLVVGLLPARTDTKWFHDYILPYQKTGFVQIRFIKGRLKFNNSKNNAPFPSMIIAWNMNRQKTKVNRLGGQGGRK